MVPTKTPEEPNPALISNLARFSKYSESPQETKSSALGKSIKGSSGSWGPFNSDPVFIFPTSSLYSSPSFFVKPFVYIPSIVISRIRVPTSCKPSVVPGAFVYKSGISVNPIRVTTSCLASVLPGSLSLSNYKSFLRRETLYKSPRRTESGPKKLPKKNLQILHIPTGNKIFYFW